MGSESGQPQLATPPFHRHCHDEVGQQASAGHYLQRPRPLVQCEPKLLRMRTGQRERRGARAIRISRWFVLACSGGPVSGGACTRLRRHGRYIGWDYWLPSVASGTLAPPLPAVLLLAPLALSPLHESLNRLGPFRRFLVVSEFGCHEHVVAFENAAKLNAKTVTLLIPDVSKAQRLLNHAR